MRCITYAGQFVAHDDSLVGMIVFVQPDPASPSLRLRPSMPPHAPAPVNLPVGCHLGTVCTPLTPGFYEGERSGELLVITGIHKEGNEGTGIYRVLAELP
jgi:hypothetical protein